MATEKVDAAWWNARTALLMAAGAGVAIALTVIFVASGFNNATARRNDLAKSESDLKARVSQLEQELRNHGIAVPVATTTTTTTTPSRTAITVRRTSNPPTTSTRSGPATTAPPDRPPTTTTTRPHETSTTTTTAPLLCFGGTCVTTP